MEFFDAIQPIEPKLDPKAAIYVRISMDQGYGEMALDRQEHECRACAARDGILIDDSRVYHDLAISAADKRKTREAYNRLVADVERGEVETVYVWDLDRLTRQPDQLGKWVDFADDGVCHIVEAHGMMYDLRRPTDVMNARIRVAVAENESKQKGARQMSAAQQRARLGFVQPQGVRPIGYTRTGEVVPDEADVVRAIFAAFNAGAGAKTIARALSGETVDGPASEVPCVPRPSYTLALEYNERHPDEPHEVPDPQPWNVRAVTRILRNARYAGFSTYGRRKEIAQTRRRAHKNAERRADTRVRDPETGGWVRGRWEPIVDVEDWERAQERLDDPKRHKSWTNTRAHLGSGLFRCSVCGGPVHLHGRAYSCKGHVMRNWDRVDAYVEDVIARVLSRPDLEGLVCTRKSADARELSELRELAARERRRLERAELDYASGKSRIEDLNRTRDFIEAELDRVNRRIAEIGDDGRAGALLREVPCAQAFREADLERKRAVIDLLCEVRLTPSNGGARRRPDGSRPVYDVTEAVQFAWKTAATPPEG